MGSDEKHYMKRLYEKISPNRELLPKYTIKTVKHSGDNIKLWGTFSWYGVQLV